jgi:hypothetical protein
MTAPYISLMTAVPNIPAIIDAVRAGALAGKESVVVAEAYAAAVRLITRPLRSPLMGLPTPPENGRNPREH